jgi:hypothetical protein
MESENYPKNETEAEVEIEAVAEAEASKFVRAEGEYYAVMFIEDDDATGKWWVVKRLFENRKGETVFTWLTPVPGLQDVYYLPPGRAADLTKRTTVPVDAARVPLEWVPAGISRGITLSAPLLTQVCVHEQRVKAHKLLMTARRKLVCGYSGEDKAEDCHKDLQNDMIQVATSALANRRRAGDEGDGGEDGEGMPSTTLRAIILDSVGFRSSRAVLAGVGLAAPRTKVAIVVPNNSRERTSMQGTEPEGVALVPVSLAEAVSGMLEPRSLDVLVADTCGTLNSELKAVLDSAFARNLFAPGAVLSVTVNCRAQKPAEVQHALVALLKGLAATYDKTCHFVPSRQYHYRQMAFVLGTVEMGGVATTQGPKPPRKKRPFRRE